MMMKQPSRKLYRHELKGLMVDKNCTTADDLLNLLFLGDAASREDTQLVVKYRYPDAVRSTMINRINRLWVLPIFIALIPFRYVAFGDYTVNEHSRLGKILTFLLGDF